MLKGGGGRSQDSPTSLLLWVTSPTVVAIQSCLWHPLWSCSWALESPSSLCLSFQPQGQKWPQWWLTSGLPVHSVWPFISSVILVADSLCLILTAEPPGFPHGSVVKNLPARAGDARDVGLISGSGRSLGGGNGNPLQYCCLLKSHGQRSLLGYSLWGSKELDTAEHSTA